MLNSLRAKRAQFFATTPIFNLLYRAHHGGFAYGGCGLFRRRSEADRGEIEYSFRVCVAFLRRVGELAYIKR